ncbi:MULTISPECIES: ATP-binding protein [unclassified Streptomyces]|uniref:sensor histidine kinase n=1 Tax=unclassified Streptomyces TaxID=2593676 RepID=UPI002DD86625|nr:ATP-binding protein [Streptomyces sp. NBC_01775]WSB77083.1 HAMP domain-containing protein [Streptomyces sp. NBC_01775]WSS43464.1 HAMP domain-containing protein [Streptomyces sp. NBC_01187]
MSVDTVDPPRERDASGRAPLKPRFRQRAGAFLDRWPFRRKLNVLVIVPIVAVGVLLGLSVNSEVGQARDAGRIAELVRDNEQVTRLINDIQAEQRQALVLSVEHESTRPGAALPSTTAYRHAQRGTDKQVTAVRSAFGSNLAKDEKQALEYIQGLAVLRDKVERGSVPAAGINPAYAAAVEYLIDGVGLDRFSGTETSSVTSLLETVLRADAAHAAFESAVFSAQTKDANSLTEYTRAVGAHAVYRHQAERFGRIGTPKQVLAMNGIERNAEENGIDAQYAELQIDPSSLVNQSPQDLRKAMAAGTRQAEARLDITESLIEQTAARADELSESALEKALALLGLALLGFASWLTFSVLVRRSVVRPLTALTGAAQQVVDVTGEELARVGEDESADSTPLRPRPIPVPVRDEVGDLAEAFNQVQVTAAALLERQVLSRRNVAEMFGNVGRRVSNLTSSQLMLIDAVEREETDPEVLERLYRIDHIAVRLQRNADSLMLLAGIRETEMEARPTTLANVLRAGLSQIEAYQRVSLRSEADLTVAPDIIGDLTLMLAELLENAVTFSPSHTPVEVVVRPGTDVTSEGGALIEVIDHGLGMSADRLAEENARLVRRERLDLVPTKVLGLFVVGSLARRWGIRVALSRTPGGGVTGTVWVPSALLLSMSPMDPTGTASAPATTTTTGTATGTAEVVPELPTGSGPGSGPEPAPPPAAGSTPPPVPVTAEPVPVAAEPVPAPASRTAPERRPAAPSTDGGLPRRVPARRSAEPTTAADDAERTTAADQPPAAQAPRPLRRRVRGATLPMTTPPPDRGIPDVRQPVDADAVRSELDEFEAAVRKAEHDSATPPTEAAPPRHQQSEGAGQ